MQRNQICLKAIRLFRWLEHRHDPIEIILLFITIVVAIILYCVTQRQADIAADTLQYQRTKDSIDAIYQQKKDSVTFSRMEDTEIRTLRAYLNLAWSNWGGNFTKSLISAGYRVMNHGQTPAKDVEIDGEIRIAPYPLPPTFKPNYPIINNLNQKMTCFPGQPDSLEKGFIPARRLFTQSEVAECTSVNSKMRFYLFAQIIYKDVFDSTRHTYICLFMDPKSLKFDSAGTMYSLWLINETHNDFD